MTMTESVPIDMLIAKVEKIWRKANDPGATDAEREIFEAKALQLMEQHRITETMLDLGYEDVLDDRLLIKLTGRNARQQIDLWDAIAKAYDSRLYWVGYGLRYDVMIFGYKSDFDRISALGHMLLVDAQTGAAKLKGYNASHTLGLRRGFMQGYTSSIRRRLAEAKQAAMDAERRNAALLAVFGPEALDDDLDWAAYEAELAEAAAADTTVSSAALVLVHRAEKVKSEFATKKMRSAASTRSGLSAGRAAGADAGDRASLTPSSRAVNTRRAIG